MSLTLIAAFGSLLTAAPSDNLVELGKIDWVRSYEKGLARAKAAKKPVFLLFTEIPGCHTVQSYGKQVLSHPQIVEAARTLFVPIAIYNNKGGADRRVLEHYGEPSWNNPVVRFISGDEKELAPRLSGPYTVTALARTMARALKSSGHPVPEYLRLLALEQHSPQNATFAMYCFWAGEAAIGALDGVIKTEAGYLGGREVVDIQFDPSTLSFSDLLKAARRNGAADHVFARTREQAEVAEALNVPHTFSNERMRPSPKDTKFHLRKTAWASVPMSETQASRVNAAIARGVDPKAFLSPEQLASAE